MPAEFDAKVPAGDDISAEIRAKVALAEKQARQLNEAGVRAKTVLRDLGPALDEIAAYIHRETGLDVLTGETAPAALLNPLEQDHDHRVAVATRWVSIPTVPPTLMLGGYQVQVGIDASIRIDAFWGVGDVADPGHSKCLNELIEGRFGGAEQATAVKRASDVLLSTRHKAAEHLLAALKALE